MRLEQFFNAFEDCMICAQEYNVCDGEGKKYSVNLKSAICTQSYISQMASDGIEDGCSECQAVVTSRKYLLEIGQDFMTRNYIRLFGSRMKPVVSAPEKAK